MTAQPQPGADGVLIAGVAPWNASWTAEDRYEVRPCRYAGGRLAIWSPYAPGEGKPVFAKPHMVRQRRSIAEMRCTVCGERTVPGNRWWFRLGALQEGWFMTAEAPVHRCCADLALRMCPHLRGRASDLEPMPAGHSVLSSIVGGPATDQDFGVAIGGRRVVGHLKLAWPLARVRFEAPPPPACSGTRRPERGQQGEMADVV